MSLLNLVSLLGLIVLAGLAWAVGGLKRPIAWRTITGPGALVLLVGLAGLAEWRLGGRRER